MFIGGLCIAIHTVEKMSGAPGYFGNRAFFLCFLWSENTMQGNSTEFFIRTPPAKLFFKASLPGAVSMLASALYQTFDGVFVGHFLGETAFAALNLAMPFVIINFALADLIGVGSSVHIAVDLGKGLRREANNIFTCAVIMIILAGALMGAALYTLAPVLMRLMGAEGEFAALAAQYLRVYAICSPVTTIIFAVDNYLRICGYIRGSMWLNIFMSVSSALLEYTFLGVLGFGIWGAALATCTGMILSALIAFSPFIRGRALLKFTRPHFTFAIVRHIVACGSPNFLNNISGRITSIILNFILVRLGGETAVSVYGILMFTDGFVQPLLYGMCDSLQPAVGCNWGAGKFSRVRAIERCCFMAAGVVSLASAVVIVLMPETITRLFVSDPLPEVLDMSAGALRLFAFTYVTRWYSFASQSYMLAVEKPLAASMISVATALIFPLVLIALLWPLGLTGIWLNFPATALLAAVLAFIILRRKRAELSRPDAQ